LERLFKDWQTRWQDCRECLEEIIPAAGFLWQTGEGARESWLTYWGYALGLRVGELDAALRILQQHESFWTGRDDREAKNALQASYGNQALILKAWGRLDEAMALYKQQEAICLELGNKYGLQKTYGNQALILINQDRLNEALVLLQKSETICIELGLKKDLGYCYWQRASLAHTQGDRQTAKEKLKQALAIFTELKMPRERDAVQANLDILSGEAPD
jgi:tetratricopeptide (TPR) repeat protein